MTKVNYNNEYYRRLRLIKKLDRIMSLYVDTAVDGPKGWTATTFEYTGWEAFDPTKGNYIHGES